MTDPSSPDPAPRRRRARYRGKNPRRFEDKYKELDPERYPEDVAKVLAAGKTPAGTHRPILVAEVLDALALRPGQVAVDCTLGYGGHAQELLRRLTPGGRLVGLDVDPVELPKTTARLRAAGWGEDVFTPVRTNFAALPRTLAELGIEQVDGVLADLGVSSMQLDDPARGFTFKQDGALDLRLNPARSPSAAEWLARATPEALEVALREFADEPHAELLASELTARRAETPFTRTLQLAEAIRDALRRHAPREGREAVDLSVRRVFQALRLAVNDELGALDQLLRQLPACLRPGGRVVLLTFHSGEDRRVKGAFRQGVRDGVYAACDDGPLRAGPAERRDNPRSASAKLRWAVRA